MDLFLIRHPAVAIAAGICYGRTDVPLATTPAIGAMAIADKLMRLGCDVGSPRRMRHFFSSPLQRSLGVAQALANMCGATTSIDARLIEIDFGRWEGCPWDSVPRTELDLWAADIANGRPHGGENVATAAARAGDWLTEWQSRVSAVNETVPSAIVLTHAGVIRLMTAYALSLPTLACIDWPLDTTGVCHLSLSYQRSQPRWTLARWNV